MINFVFFEEMKVDFVEEIKNNLKKSKIDFESVEVDDAASLYQVFKSLIPDRSFNYDSECIDEISYYEELLESHAKRTLGEFYS